MIIVMRKGASEKDVKEVVSRIEALNFKAHVSKGVERCIIGAVGDSREKPRLKELAYIKSIERIVSILSPYKLAAKDVNPKGSIIKISDKIEIGARQFIVIAGPCSVESEKQTIDIAKMVKKAQCHILRGGAFKPRTSPYSFQGLGEEGLRILAKARKLTGLPVITEVMNHQDVDIVEKYADILQVGARNIQNFVLLKRLGFSKKPVLLKRGMMTTIEELLMSAEYILSSGNANVILCERGIRTFETATRNTLDLSSVPVLKEKTHLPIIVDPSHATGAWHLVSPMAYAAVAAGADGIMVEVHDHPELAESDGPQSLKPKTLFEMMKKISLYVKVAGRTL
jgi:3-deoxy-7-phosphoheptulonate synthase